MTLRAVLREPLLHFVVIGGLLFGSSVLIYWTNWERVQEIYLFAAVLLIQSLPFLAAAGLAALEGSRLNEYAFWIGLRSRLVGMIPGRGTKPLAPQGPQPM